MMMMMMTESWMKTMTVGYMWWKRLSKHSTTDIVRLTQLDLRPLHVRSTYDRLTQLNWMLFIYTYDWLMHCIEYTYIVEHIHCHVCYSLLVLMACCTWLRAHPLLLVKCCSLINRRTYSANYLHTECEVTPPLISVFPVDVVLSKEVRIQLYVYNVVVNYKMSRSGILISWWVTCHTLQTAVHGWTFQTVK